MENTNHKPSGSEKPGFDETSNKNGTGKSADKQENENESGKLSDYPEGNLDEEQTQTASIPGNQTDRPEADE